MLNWGPTSRSPTTTDRLGLPEAKPWLLNRGPSLRLNIHYMLVIYSGCSCHCQNNKLCLSDQSLFINKGAGSILEKILKSLLLPRQHPLWMSNIFATHPAFNASIKIYIHSRTLTLPPPSPLKIKIFLLASFILTLVPIVW